MPNVQKPLDPEGDLPGRQEPPPHAMKAEVPHRGAKVALNLWKKITDSFGARLQDCLEDNSAADLADAEARELASSSVLKTALYMVSESGAFPLSDSEFWRILSEHSQFGPPAAEIASLLKRLCQEGSRLCIAESHPGVVAHRHGKETVVVYEIEDDLVEHNYDQSRFIDGRIPERDDRLEVFAYVVICPREPETTTEPLTSDSSDERRTWRRNRITGPQEF